MFSPTRALFTTSSNITTDPYFYRTVLLLKTLTSPNMGNQDFRDDSTNILPISANGNVTQGSLSPYIPSGYWSCYFDGSGDYLTVPSSPNFAFGTGDFTIEAWVYLTTSDTLILSNANADNSDVNYISFHAGTSQTQFQVRDALLDGQQFITGPAISMNTWNHVAVSKSSGTIRVFANGVSGTPTASSKSITQKPIIISGFLYPGYISYGNGYISNLRIVKGTALYTTNFTPSTTPLTAVSGTSLLTCQDNCFLDRSSNAFTLTAAGNVAITRLAPWNVKIPVSQLATGSVAFDGSGDYLSTPNVAALRLGAGDFTVEAWINPTVITNTYASIICGTYGYVGNQDLGWNFCLNSSGYLQLFMGGSGGTALTLTASTITAANTWSHVVAVRSGTTVSLYINGTLVGTTTSGKNEDYSVPDFNVGTGRADNISPATGNPGLSFNGNISNLRIVKGTAVYTAAFTPPTTPLTAISGTSLLTCQSASAITDNSANNLTLTVAGNTYATGRSPYKTGTLTYGGSGYFGGSGDYLSLSATSTTFPSGNDAYCIEAWIYPTAIGMGTIIGWGDYGTTNKTNVLRLSNNEVGYGYELVNYWWANDLYSTGKTNAINLNTWQHVAATFDGTTRRLFVNGAVVGSDTPTGHNVTKLDNVTVGARSGGSDTFTGQIANFRVVKGSAVYTAAFTPPTSPVTAISATSLLLNFDNAAMYDSTGYSDLIPTSSTLPTVGTGSNTTAVSFGGSEYLRIPMTTALQMGSGDWTFECWAYPLAGTGFIYSDRSANTYDGISIWIGSGKIGCVASSSNSSWNSCYSIGNGNDVPTMTWSHIAVTRNGANWRAFINGTLSWTYTSTVDSPIQAGPVNLGWDAARPSSTGVSDFSGFLSDVRITNGVARYTANFTAPARGFPTQ